MRVGVCAVVVSRSLAADSEKLILLANIELEVQQGTLPLKCAREHLKVNKIIIIKVPKKKSFAATLNWITI